MYILHLNLSRLVAWHYDGRYPVCSPASDSRFRLFAARSPSVFYRDPVSASAVASRYVPCSSWSGGAPGRGCSVPWRHVISRVPGGENGAPGRGCPVAAVAATAPVDGDTVAVVARLAWFQSQ